MRIGIQTWGSHGDVRPFVALADGLQAAGHDVTLVITCVDSDRYAALRTATGFRVRLVASPVIAERAELEQIGAGIVAERNAIRQTQRVIEQLLLPAESALFEAAVQLCAESDVVIGHCFAYPLSVAAEKVGRPWVSVALAPGAVPSAFVPPPGLPNLGGLGNRLGWWLARRVLNPSLKRYPDRLRAAQGMPAAGDMIDTVWASEQLTLLAVSPALCERRPDWPRHVQVCGSLDTQDSVAEGSVPEELQSFLAAGPAPVFMTLGSMLAGSDERETLALLAQAARTAGVRAVLQAPVPGRQGLSHEPDLFWVGAVPHAAVFPRCSAVLHHGGAGTSQATLRAGVPSVVIPHTAEQVMWGRELEGRGVAGRPIHRRVATPQGIAAAIRQVTQTESLRRNARVLGARVAQDDGVAVAVRLITERFAAG